MVLTQGLVCEKNTARVVFPRQEEEDRRVRQEVSSITQDDTVDEEDLEDVVVLFSCVSHPPPDST
jgi:hypothetical protein